MWNPHLLPEGLLEANSLHDVRNLLPVIHRLLEFHIALGDQHIHHRQLLHVSISFELLPDLGPYRGDGDVENIDFDKFRDLSSSNSNQLHSPAQAVKG